MLASVGFAFLIGVAAATAVGALDAAGPTIVRTETFTTPTTRAAASCVRPIDVKGDFERATPRGPASAGGLS